MWFLQLFLKTVIYMIFFLTHSLPNASIDVFRKTIEFSFFPPLGESMVKNVWERLHKQLTFKESGQN